VHFPRIVLGSEPVGIRLDLKTETIERAAPRLSKTLDVPEA
jgi:hypothetical protein